MCEALRVSGPCLFEGVFRATDHRPGSPVMDVGPRKHRDAPETVVTAALPNRDVLGQVRAGARSEQRRSSSSGRGTTTAAGDRSAKRPVVKCQRIGGAATSWNRRCATSPTTAPSPPVVTSLLLPVVPLVLPLLQENPEQRVFHAC